MALRGEVSRFSKALIFIAAGVGASPAYAVPAQGHQIMIAGPSPYAVDIGRKIFLKGGNAVDVATAVGLTLAVTTPYYAAFGGGGFALIKMGGDAKALDFREMAPTKANPDTYKGKPSESSRDGGLAVGVPGVAAGLYEMHKKYGKLKWSALFDSVLELTDKGFRVSGEWTKLTERNKERFNDPGRKFLFAKGTVALKPGDLLRQPQLGKFLRAYRAHGPKAFYEGSVAKEVVDTVNKGGGDYSLQDLKNYKVRWLEPLTAEVGGNKIYLMPPPSSGGVVIAQALRLMEKTNLAQVAPLSVDEFHLLAEIEKLSFKGRALLGDPDFAKNPIDHLLSETYLNELASSIKPDSSVAVETPKPVPHESENTTHFSVMDARGNAVSLTVTLNGDYGSGLVTPVSGIALNNEMDDFTTKPGQPNMFGLIQGEANNVRAGARPLSSMSPTIVTRNGLATTALGAPGGPRIITAVFQVLYRLLTQKMDVDQAVQAPRVHHQYLPDIVRIDAMRFAPETLEGLKARGHKTETSSTGKVYAVRIDENGILSGAADARGEGAAGGL